MGEYHVERDQEEQGSTGDSKRTQRDSHGVEKFRAGDREHETNPERDGAGLEGHASLVVRRRAFRQSGEQRDQGDGFDDDEENHEEFEELFGHHHAASRKN